METPVLEPWQRLDDLWQAWERRELTSEEEEELSVLLRQLIFA